jgi:hypothetical protein
VRFVMEPAKCLVIITKWQERPRKKKTKISGFARFLLLKTKKIVAINAGAGKHDKPDVQEIVKMVVASRGKRKGMIKTTRPPCGVGVLFDRAYYVWRMARFHSGADVTMPMSASCLADGDAYLPTLDTVALLLVARENRGGDRVGAARWKGALGGSYDDSIAHPAASPRGPVCDGNKPVEELLELF